MFGDFAVDVNHLKTDSWKKENAEKAKKNKVEKKLQRYPICLILAKIRK